ncbi:MAG: DinB family protein [Ignavibacteria bacterium]|nr:DinB family protein [Ignavibacteria bacterium]
MNNSLSKLLAKQYMESAGWADWILRTLSDDDLKLEIAPGKNHGVWILGHLIACEDDFSLYMGKGEITIPDYQKLFCEGSKLQPVENYPPVSELREKWNEIIRRNKKIYDNLTDEELTELHANEKDANNAFWKTKEDVVIHWQLHLMYHAGQLALLTSKAGKILTPKN